MEPRIQYAKTEDGVSIAYYTMGERVPIVWIPNIVTSNIQTEWDWPFFRAIYEPLIARRMLVRYDPRGFGLSDRDAPQSAEGRRHDLRAVIDALGVETIDLLGATTGGHPAIEYAAAHPDKVSNLILMDCYASGQDVSTNQVISHFEKTLAEDFESYTNAIAAENFGLKGDDAHHFAQLVRASVSQQTLLELYRNRRQEDVTDLLPQVKAPTLVIRHGGLRNITMEMARELVVGIPNAQLQIVDGKFSDNIDKMNAAIAEFLDGGDREAAQEDGSVPSDATQTQIVPPPEAETFASGRYVVKRLLGQGAQKSVYLVDDTVLGRQCALSMLNPALLDPGDVDRLKREAQTMAQFGTQPNIVTVYDYGEEDGAPFIVCEYVPGGELRNELAAASGPLPLERALAVGIDICRALSFAHGRDIVHRDLKPENVWLTEERNAKLGDFGIALSLSRARLTAPGSVTGTALYMAPEQASGGDVDARSDLYALGVLLYELVAGRPPFVGEPNAIIYQHINTSPESPATHNTSVPPSLERLIMSLLAKPKAERPSSAEEVLTRLERAVTELARGPADAGARRPIDMEQSSASAQSPGDSKVQQVRRVFAQILHKALRAHDGTETKHADDHIMGSFTTAPAALECAIAIQRGVAAHRDEHPDSPLAVYLDLATGEPSVEEDPSDTSISLAARICDAEVGQILAGDAVRQLAADSEFLFAGLGEKELRGFEDPVKLWELRWEDADS